MWVEVTCLTWPPGPSVEEPHHAGVPEFQVVVVQKAEYTELVVSSVCVCVFLSQHTLQILY